ncbi:MAG TPA: amidohydrolase family protein [Kofleriaceae bacterium]|jgi:aminocarboxymuconate-semialdehyde decarboxylase|nr:amidohydrolase family protein [Kofleriaceae bacterium]
MTTRREFLTSAVGLAGVCFVGCSLLGPHRAHAQGRRSFKVGGKRVKVIDVHSHAAVPEALELAGAKLGEGIWRPEVAMPQSVDQRLAGMDAQGIDVEALSINAFWYGNDREVAARICQLQNEKLAEVCGKHPDRFVAYATVALQYPELAAEQLEHGVKKLGLRGAAIGGSCAGKELSDPAFHPFWAKAEALGVPIFIHPQPTGAPSELKQRLQGNGYLENVVGNPLETTLALSHLIFGGALDQFPRIKIIAAHGGGFLPSYAGRADHGCLSRPASCPGGAFGPIKKKPSEYLKQMYYDSMVFSAEGLRHLAAEVGASQIVVGTDSPYPWTTTAVEHVLNTPTLSDADKLAILQGNAARLLNIATQA